MYEVNLIEKLVIACRKNSGSGHSLVQLMNDFYYDITSCS